MTDTKVTLPKFFMAIAIFALIWNLMGVAAFFMDVLRSEESLATMSEAERALHESSPIWLKVVYGLAVFPGLIGAIGLLVKKEFATLAFLVSLIAVILQMGYTVFMTDLINVYGFSFRSVVLPLMVVLIAGFLYYWSMKGIARGWLTE